MSREIDEAVVRMEFDNGQFERNVQESLGTLDKLKKALNLDKSSQSLKELDRVGNGLHLGSVEKQIGMIAHRMTALGQISAGVWNRIASDAVACGKRVANAFTVQPVKDGFSEYELKMQSVQTIMASTGEDIKTVSKYLEMLNQYADQTIYSFSDMTASIGKFTNAGVKLDDAVSAIQGISNEAALSGANANEASRAMYNFAQALSAGYVKLIDWKSIENANMATQEFKKQLIETGLELGTLKKKGDAYVTTTTNLRGKTSDAFTSTKMFNESLEYQWMTTDVLTKTLGKYANKTTDIGKRAFQAAQEVKTFSQLIDTLKEAAGSGWAQSFEHVFGNKNEAVTLWTEVSNALGGVLDKLSDTRNEMLKTWKEMGGRKDLIQSMRNLGTGLVTILEPLQKGFHNVFPAMTAKRLVALTKQFKEFTAGLKLNEEQQENLRRAMVGLMMPFKITKSLISDMFNIIKAIGPTVVDKFLAFAGKLGDIFVEIEYFYQVIRTVIITTLEYFNIVENLGNVLGFLYNTISSGITGLFNGILMVFGWIGSLFGLAVEPAQTLGDVIWGIAGAIAVVLDGVVIPAVMGLLKAFDQIGKKVKGWGKKLNVAKKFEKVFKAISNIVKQFRSVGMPVLSKFGDWLKGLGSTAIDFVVEKLDKLVELLSNVDIKLPEIDFGNWFQSLKSNLQNGLKSFSGFTKSMKKENDILGTNLKIKKGGFDFGAIFTGVKTFASGAISGIQNLVSKGKLLSNIVTTIQNLFGKLHFPKFDLGNIIVMFANFRDTIGGVAEKLNIFKAIGFTVNSIISTLSNSFGKLFESINPVSEATEEMTDKAKGMTGLGDIFKNLGAAVREAGEGFKDFIAGFDPAKAAAFAFVGIVSLMSLEVLTMISTINKLLTSVKGVTDSSKFFLDATTDVVKRFGETYLPIKKAKLTITEFATAVAVLVGAIWLLSDIPGEDIAKGGVAILGLMGLLLGFTYLANKINPTVAAADMLKVVLPLAAGLYILIEVLKKLNAISIGSSEADFEVLKAKFIAMAGLVGMMALVGFALSKTQTAWSGLSALGIAAAFYIIIDVMKQLSALMLGPFGRGATTADQLRSMIPKLVAFTAIAVVVGGLGAAFAVASSKIGNFRSALGMVAILLALKTLVPIMKDIAAINYDKVAEALNKYKWVIVIVGGLMLALSALNTKGNLGKNMKNIGIGFAAMATSALILAKACKAFGKLKAAELEKGLQAIRTIGLIMGALAVISAFSRGNPLQGIAGLFIGLGVAVTAMTGAVYLLGSMDQEILMRGVTAVGIMALILAGAAALSNITKGTMDFKSIIAVVVGLVALGGLFILLSYMPWENLKTAVIALGAVAAALSVTLIAAGKAAKDANGLQIGVLLSVTASLGVLAYSLYELSKRPWREVAAAGAAITAGLLAFAAVVKVLSTIHSQTTNIGAMIGSLLGAVAAVAVVCLAVSWLSNSGGDQMLEASLSISVGLLAFGAMLEILGAVGAVAPLALEGAKVAGIVALALLAAIEIIGAINQEIAKGKLTEWAASAGEIIGAFIGGIVEGGLSEASKSLPKIGQNLSDFMVNSAFFWSEINTIDDKKLKNVTNLMQALGDIGASAKDIKDFDEFENFKQFGEGISNFFGEAMPTMLESLKDFDPDEDATKISKAAGLLKKLAEAASEIPTVSVVGWDTNKYQGGFLSQFLTDLKGLAPVLTEMVFGSSDVPGLGGLQNLTDDHFKGIRNAAKCIAELGKAAKEIPSFDGLVEAGFDINPIQDFAEGLTALAPALTKMAELVFVPGSPFAGGITPDQLSGMDGICDVISKLADVAKEMPTGYSASKLLHTGKQISIATFAQQLSFSIEPLKEFVSKCQGFGDLSNVTELSEALKKIGEIATIDLQPSNFTKLSSSLASFAQGGLTSAIHAIKEAGDPAELISSIGAIDKLIIMLSGNFDISKISSLGKELETFGSKLKKFSSDAANFNAGKMLTLTMGLRSLKSVAQDFQGADLGSISKFMGSVKNATKGSAKGIGSAASEAVEQSLGKIKAKAKNFNTVGKNLINQMINGMKSRGSAVQSAGKSVAEKGAQGAKSERSGFETAGRYCIQGLASGLADSGAVQSAINAARNAVKKAVQAAKDEADIQSPSKKFIEIGGYMVSGLYHGLEDRSKLLRVQKASVNMAKASWQSFNNYLGIHSDSRKFKWSAKYSVSGFVNELKNRVGKIKKSGKNFANNFFGSFNNPLQSLMDGAGKSASNKFTNSFGNELSKGLGKSGKGLGRAAGGAGSSVGAAAGAAAGKAVEEFTKKDSKKAALLYASIFQKTLIDYDPFNKKFLKNKKISVPYDTSKINIKEVGLKYVNASIKSTALRSAMDILGSEVVKRINKKIVKEVKNNGKGALSNARIKQITKDSLKDIQYAYNELNLIMSQFDKKTRKAIKAVPEAVAAYVKNYKSVASFDKGLIKTVKKQFGSDMKETRGKLNSLISTYDDGLRRLKKQKKEWDKVLDDDKSTKKQKKQAKEQIKILSTQINNLTKQRKKLVDKKKLAGGATTMLDTFAQQLYYNSSEFKTTKKNLTKNIKDLEKIQKKADKAMAIVQDPKKSAKQKKEALKNLESYAKESKKLKKSIAKDTKAMAEGPGKALTKFKNELKKVYKEYLKLSNVKLADPIISGYTWEASEKAANSYNDALSKTVETTAEVSGSVEASAEAFDILSASMGSSINLFDKFTKTGSAEVSALLENADTQIDAYTEFYEGLAELESKGLAQSVLDDLEEQGIEGLNYIRGFRKMSESEIAEYNEKARKRDAFQNKQLQRSLEKQLAQYEDWMTQINTLIGNKVLDKVTLDTLVTKIKSAGYNAAYEFVKAFNLMGESEQLRLGEIYSKSISEELVNFGQEASATVQSWEKDSFSSYLEALEAQVEKDKAWDQMLSDLAAKGYSKDVINQFKEAGYDSAHVMVESALAETEDGVKRINEIFAEVADDPFQNAIDNRKKQNDVYDEYKNNQDLVKGNIQFLRDMAKYPKEVRALYEETFAGISEIDDLDTFADHYQKVFDNIVSLGYSEADALKYLTTATTKQIEAMYTEINRSDSINKKNREEQFKKEWEQRRDNLVHYQNLYKRVESHTTDMDPKARERLMAEIKSMGVDDAIAYMETFQYAWQHDTKGWTKFQETYADNAKLADDTADSIISSYSAVFTKAAEVLESSLSSASKKAAKLTGEELDKILSKTEMLRKSGEYTKALGDGMTGQLKTIKDASISVAKATVSPFKSRLKAEKGKNLATQYASGISTGITEAKSGVKTDAAKLGKGIVNGTKEGITDNEEKVVKAVRKMAKNALQAGCEELGVNSPSKEFIEIGRYVDEGFAMGLEEHSGIAVESMSSLAKLVLQEGMIAAQMINQSLASGIDVEDIQLQSMQDAINRIMEFVDGDLDTSPVITPVIDLDSVRKQAEEMNGLFGDMSAHVNAALYPQNQNGQSNTNNGMTFIQNNYSPEALDRLEIFRQTRNQFAQAKQIIGGR